MFVSYPAVLGSGDEVKVKVAQLCPTLCDPMDYVVHGILQARILEWVALSLLQGIFPIQGLNPGLPHCRQILYQLSYQGSPSSGDGELLTPSQGYFHTPIPFTKN